MKQKLPACMATFLLPAMAHAIPVDLSSWIENGFNGGDDGFIGFALGYQADELNSLAADFWLIDWKQRNQSRAQAGLALSQVTGGIPNGGTADPSFWEQTGTVDEKVRATNLASTGYVHNRAYTFKLTFADTLIQVFVDGVLEIDYADNFIDGAFGFYNYSQANVDYAGITEDNLPPAVPLPASLPLLLAGFGALGLTRRRRKK